MINRGNVVTLNNSNNEKCIEGVMEGDIEKTNKL